MLLNNGGDVCITIERSKDTLCPCFLIGCQIKSLIVMTWMHILVLGTLLVGGGWGCVFKNVM